MVGESVCRGFGLEGVSPVDYREMTRRVPALGVVHFTHVGHAPHELDGFVRDAELGVPAIVGFLNRWAARVDDLGARAITLAYEDLQADPEGQLGCVLDFMGLTAIGPAARRAAVDTWEIGMMQEAERSGALPTVLEPGDPDDLDSFKTRRGVVGGWVDYLTGEDAVWATDYVRTHLDPRFGHPREYPRA
jgi:hypothetical protein